jgi:dUTP pyrophosphatase
MFFACYLRETPPMKPTKAAVMKISVKRLDRELPVPTHSHSGDAGVDLYTSIDFSIQPGDRLLVPTGLAVAVPDGHVGLVCPRSGLAVKQGISVVNAPGVVDSGYRGEVKVALINHGTDEVQFTRGSRIAQLLVMPVVEQELVEVDELAVSERDIGGFGSTGD